MEGAAVVTGRDLGVGGFGLGEGMVAGKSDDAVEFRVELLMRSR